MLDAVLLSIAIPAQLAPRIGRFPGVALAMAYAFFTETAERNAASRQFSPQCCKFCAFQENSRGEISPKLNGQVFDHRFASKKPVPLHALAGSPLPSHPQDSPGLRRVLSVRAPRAVASVLRRRVAVRKTIKITLATYAIKRPK